MDLPSINCHYTHEALWPDEPENEMHSTNRRQPLYLLRMFKMTPHAVLA